MNPPAPPIAAPPQTIDDLFADVARQAPGFGGLYVDEDQDTLYVYLFQDTPEAVAALDAALTAVFGPERPQYGRTVVLQGQYSFLELKAWSDRMTGVVLGIPGVTLSDIKDSRNRLLVGVETSEVKDLVEEQLALLGIPREVVDIEQRPAVKPEISLQTMHRPVVGGLRTSACTLGFNARRQGVPGFVVNSHCTDITGGVEDTVFYQPSSPDRIGVETVDPPYVVTKAMDDRCPLSYWCRYSDSAFVARDDGVEADRGFIARPPLDSGNWNGVDTFRIVEEATTIVEGRKVTKVGINTGRTEGTITGTCVHTPVLNANRAYICQAQATYNSAGGDSGAPVFWTNPYNPNDYDVTLYGIHWGGPPATFSPIQYIQDATFELGPLTKCAPFFGC